MMGDISRKTFDPRKHYSGVLQQQGRVQVDADWNEQLAIQHHRTETESRDVIGQCGVPEKGGGFKIEKTPGEHDLMISPGRIYVDGLLCELDTTAVPVTFTQDTQTVQGNQAVVAASIVDHRPWLAGQWVELSAASKPSKLLQITTVDERLLTVSEDITDYRTADAALRRMTTYITQPDYPNPDFTTGITSPLTSPLSSPPSGLTQLSLGDGTYVVYLDAWRREITALDDRHIREVALGGPDTSTRLKTVWQVRFLPVTGAGNGQPTCDTSFNEWNDLTRGSTGTLNARTKSADDPKDPCLLPPSAGYRRLENQLYRVEIHTGGARGVAAFKWSRDNATVETSIEQIAGNKVTVADVGKDDVLGFANGQWVEVVDDESELKSAPRPLVQIESVDPGTRRITMKTSLSSLESLTRLKLRRWDHNGGTTADGVVSTADWIDLEGGIQVQLSEGNYRPGDYWLIPARTATGDIEWPPFAIPNTQPAPQPPAGVRHHYCRLALAEVRNGTLTIQDCRQLFPSLTDIRTEEEPGIHITGVDLSDLSLRNDGDVPAPALIKGIRVRCDEKIEPASVGKPERPKPTCFVTLDVPFPLNDIDRGLWGDLVIGFQPLLLAAKVTVDGEGIHWAPTDATQAWLSRLLTRMSDLRLGDRVLAHLTLKGNFIWAQRDSSLYLDGDVFGFQQDGGANTDIRLPSGNGRRGGDFEMWFWLVAPPAPPIFKVRGVRILRTESGPDDPNATVLGTLAVSPTTSPMVRVTAGDSPNAIEVQFTVAPDTDSLVRERSVIVARPDGTRLNGEIRLMRDNTTVRWVPSVASAAGLTSGQHSVTLNGSGDVAITAQGVALDGEPTALPSGDNVPGGDFRFTLSVE
jgi:hypothetical protein